MLERLVVYEEVLAEEGDGVAGSGEAGFVAGVEEGEPVEAQVEARVDQLLVGGQLSRWSLHSEICYINVFATLLQRPTDYIQYLLATFYLSEVAADPMTLGHYKI